MIWAHWWPEPIGSCEALNLDISLEEVWWKRVSFLLRLNSLLLPSAILDLSASRIKIITVPCSEVARYRVMWRRGVVESVVRDWKRSNSKSKFCFQRQLPEFTRPCFIRVGQGHSWFWCWFAWFWYWKAWRLWFTVCQRNAVNLNPKLRDLLAATLPLPPQVFSSSALLCRVSLPNEALSVVLYRSRLHIYGFKTRGWVHRRVF